jgi:hypothetical protein
LVNKLGITTTIGIAALSVAFAFPVYAAPAALDISPATAMALELSLVSLDPLLTEPGILDMRETSLLSSISAVVSIPASLWLMLSALGASSCVRRVFGGSRD